MNYEDDMDDYTLTYKGMVQARKYVSKLKKGIELDDYEMATLTMAYVHYNSEDDTFLTPSDYKLMVSYLVQEGFLK